MKLTLIAAFAAIVGLASASANPEKEEGRKHRGKPFAADRSLHMKKILEEFDKDGDGRISLEERKAIAADRKAKFLEKFDKDGDGKISTEEKKAIAEEWKKRGGHKPRPGGHKPRPDRPEGGRPERPERPQGGRPERPERPEGDRPRPERPEGRRPGHRKPQPRKKVGANSNLPCTCGLC